MIKIIIPKFINNKNILTKELLKDICLKTYGNDKYEIEIEKRENGRYIRLYDAESVYYVCLSATEKEYDGRNSFLAQYLGTTVSRFELDDMKNKKIAAYLLMKNKKAFTLYQKFIYRCCRTYGINLLNLDDMIFPFSSYKEMKNVRTSISDRNTGNKSSYFSDTGDFVEFFAKCYGANGKESFFMAMVVKKLTDKPIIIYQVEDNGSKKLSEPDREVLKKNGFSFGEDIIENEFNKVDLTATEKDLRNQPAFRLNLFKKFGDKKCYLCDCDIDNMIIASHIHRVTDIKHDVKLTDDEKKKQIIDGENGLWLCANHDKLFEFGLIYFDDKKLVVTEKLQNYQQKYIKRITNKLDDIFEKSSEYFVVAEESESYENNVFYIDDKDFTYKMKCYLKLHKLRSERVKK